MASPGSGGRRPAPVLVGWRYLPAPGDPLVGLDALGDGDRRRLAQFDDRRQRAFVTGRALLADLLGRHFGTGTVDTGSCPVCGGDHGPVVVRGAAARASVSYAGDLVVAAVGGVARLGVDVEAEPGGSPADRRRAEDLGRLLGTPAAAAIERWTQVEAVLKADGRGLRVDPGQVRVDGASAGVADDPARYRLRRVDAPAGFLVSVAWSDRPGAAAWGAGAGRAIR